MQRRLEGCSTQHWRMEDCEVPFEVTAVIQRSVGTGGDGDSTPTKHGVPGKQEQREIDTDERKQECPTNEARGVVAPNFRGWKQAVKDGTPTWTAEWSGDWQSAQLWWGWSDEEEQDIANEWSFLGRRTSEGNWEWVQYRRHYWIRVC